MNDVTLLLDRMAGGDAAAGDRLIVLVYADLRRMATQRMRSTGPAQTLQPTALVHEAWLRMGGGQMRHCRDRAHFFATAATVMRSILVDRARRRNALRHGGGQVRVALEGVDIADGNANDDQVLAVHEALEKFAIQHPEKAELVKLRYFVGLSMAEAADVLGVSEPTTHRWWKYARGWLGHEIAF